MVQTMNSKKALPRLKKILHQRQVEIADARYWQNQDNAYVNQQIMPLIIKMLAFSQMMIFLFYLFVLFT